LAEYKLSEILCLVTRDRTRPLAQIFEENF
jgi:hypothetical protein